MLTASIVLYKNPLDECHTVLDCLLAASVDKIYLIDHSGDNRLAVLREYSEKLEYISQKNSGYGSGHNVALREVLKINPDGFHIVLNADTVFLPETTEILKRFMTAHPEAGLCMPDIRNKDGSRQYLCKYLPSPFELFGKRFLPEKLMRPIIDRLTMKKADYSKILSVPWLSGCFMFLRVSALKKVGLFDECFFLYAEDIDLSRRIAEKFENLYCPETVISHAHKAGSYHQFKLLLVHIQSAIRYFNKWGWIFDSSRKKINRRAVERNRIPQ